MTDCPGEDGVAGDHQVVDGEGDQGAVVGGDTRRAQDLFSKGRCQRNFTVIYTIFGWGGDTSFTVYLNTPLYFLFKHWIGNRLLASHLAVAHPAQRRDHVPHVHTTCQVKGYETGCSILTQILYTVMLIKIKVFKKSSPHWNWGTCVQ